MNKFITFIVSMRENNHHHTVYNLESFHFAKCFIFHQYIASKSLIYKFLYHNIHFRFASGSKPSFFQVFLPSIKIYTFQCNLSFIIKLIEFVFEKFSHCSKTRSIEKEIELLIIFFWFWIGSINLWYFDWFVWYIIFILINNNLWIIILFFIISKLFL